MDKKVLSFCFLVVLCLVGLTGLVSAIDDVEANDIQTFNNGSYKAINAANKKYNADLSDTWDTSKTYVFKLQMNGNYTANSSLGLDISCEYGSNQYPLERSGNGYTGLTVQGLFQINVVVTWAMQFKLEVTVEPLGQISEDVMIHITGSNKANTSTNVDFTLKMPVSGFTISKNVSGGYAVLYEADSDQSYFNTRNPDQSQKAPLNDIDMVGAGTIICIIPNPIGAQYVSQVAVNSSSGTIQTTTVQDPNNSNNKQYFFTMPDENVTLSVTFNSHTINIVSESGTVSIWRTEVGGSVLNGFQENATSYFAFSGETVTLQSKSVSSGYGFLGFQSSEVNLVKENNGKYTFTMGESDVTVTALYGQYHDVAVTQSAGGTISTDKAKALNGEIVSVTVETADGYRLSGWENTPGTISIENGTFAMPDSDVTLKAVFEKLPEDFVLTPNVVSDGSSGLVLDVSISGGDGNNVQDPRFLIICKYEGSIVINTYSRVTLDSDTPERVIMSSQGLKEVIIELIDGVGSALVNDSSSSIPVPLGFCQYIPSQ